MFRALQVGLLLMALNATAQTGDSGELPSGDELDFFLGAWDLVSESLQRDGSYSSQRARSDVYRILDGNMLQDDFRLLADDGSVVFRGTSLRGFLPREGHWSIKWIMVGEPGMTDIRANWTGEELVMEGEGYDGMGEFLERARYFDISEDSYEFVLSRSYDGGETWIEDMNLIHATRIAKHGSRSFSPPEDAASDP